MSISSAKRDTDRKCSPDVMQQEVLSTVKKPEFKGTSRSNDLLTTSQGIEEDINAMKKQSNPGCGKIYGTNELVSLTNN